MRLPFMNNRKKAKLDLYGIDDHSCAGDSTSHSCCGDSVSARKAELEELRSKGLARALSARLKTAKRPKDVGHSFYSKQKAMQDRVRKSKVDAQNFLHGYRAENESIWSHRRWRGSRKVRSDDRSVKSCNDLNLGHLATPIEISYIKSPLAHENIIFPSECYMREENDYKEPECVGKIALIWALLGGIVSIYLRACTLRRFVALVLFILCAKGMMRSTNQNTLLDIPDVLSAEKSTSIAYNTTAANTFQQVEVVAEPFFHMTAQGIKTDAQW